MLAVKLKEFLQQQEIYWYEVISNSTNSDEVLAVAEKALVEVREKLAGGRWRTASRQSRYTHMYWKSNLSRWEAQVRIQGKLRILATGTNEEDVRERGLNRARELGLNVEGVLVPKKPK